MNGADNLFWTEDPLQTPTQGKDVMSREGPLIGGYEPKKGKPQRESSLVRWLRAHTCAWHGWPSQHVFDARKEIELVEQLMRHDFPFSTTRDGLDNVTNAVLHLRAERYGRYAKSVDREM